MNLPILIEKLYGEFTFTGLYSFEFVDKNRNTITEIFLMVPPKTKSVSEPTRSSTIPTLGGNYNTDGGNATKTITLGGELYFPYVGSPNNPVARDNAGLENVLNGMEEYLKLRWMLVRYRDYTMTQNAEMTVPTNLLNVSKEINALYKKVSKKVNDKTGALYDEIKLIFHDYDMDDHYFCRVDNFTSNQSDSKYIAIEYNLTLELYEPDSGQKKQSLSTQNKKSTNEQVDIVNVSLQDTGFEDSFSNIQAEIGFNVSFINSNETINSTLELINDENENIQAGKSTASTNLPTYTKALLSAIDVSLDEFINTFLSEDQRACYPTGGCIIDEIVSQNLSTFYNSLQATKIQAQSLNGILNSIVKIEDLRYYSDADDYTLTEEQFDSEDSQKVENTTNFFYYTVMQGDTARIVAQRELNDQEKFIKILQINNISENSFIDGTLVGQKIKIPFPTATLSRGSDNLIFESNYEDTEKFLFGSDIATTDSNELMISETGDLLAIIGIENSYNNIENRLNNNKGSLNVFHPNWGTISIDDSNAPFLVKLDRYLSDVISQIQSEPRVESVEMDLDKLEWDGETVSVPSKVFFIGTEETREVMV